MVPREVRSLFWDIDHDTFVPESYPDFSIFRVLEYGDDPAVTWMRQIFSELEIRRVLRTEGRLTRKSANFWALVYEIPFHEIAALQDNRSLSREP